MIIIHAPEEGELNNLYDIGMNMISGGTCVGMMCVCVCGGGGGVQPDRA